MKQIERLNLIDSVARELQSRMTYDDIDIYLSGFDINIETSKSYNSKWSYAKDLLAKVDINTI